MDEFENFKKKLLKFCEDEKASVSREPRNETERGFKIATMLMCTKLNSMVLREDMKYKRTISLDDNVAVDAFIKLLDDKLAEHDEDESLEA